MHLIRRMTRQIVPYIVALVLVAGYPLSAMADTQEPATPAPVPAATSEQPVLAPVVQQPSTSQTPLPAPATATAPTPSAAPVKTELHYTYNPTTQHWDSEQWQYNPVTGVYERPPAPVVITPTTDNSSTKDTKSVDTSVKVENGVNSNATSGDSTVKTNTTGGSATTGDAAATANLLNIVNSAVTTGNNQKIATFTKDVMGDVKGDIILYPMMLKAMLEAEAGGNAGSAINVKNNLQVDNNVNLNARSGNANVTNNTTAGNAATGSATAVANVVNILNSMIATQQSFIGTINIYGNLEGDILVAPDFIPQMIANNKVSSPASTQLSTQTSTDIVNNISAMAKSGAAAVFGNTTAGDATTGTANTGVVIFNLTGHDIIAKNSLLVFVNVMGKWVGAIVDAPVGATAAMLGNGVTTNNQAAPDLKVSAQSKQGITNTIAVNAESGDAVVSGNTTAGNATTGQAMALANIANISGSQFGISDWFGVLFINVFQNWYGSFGIDTPYGNAPEVHREAPTGPIEFMPKAANSRSPVVRSVSGTIGKVNDQLAQLSSDTNMAPAQETNMSTLGASTAREPAATAFNFQLLIAAGSLLAIGLSIIGLKRLFN